MQWSIRNLLNPVITRVLLFGTNSIDLEYILRDVEKKPLLNGKALEKTWHDAWCKKAEHFAKLGNDAEKRNLKQSIYHYNMLAAQCYYACYMINSEDIDGRKGVYEKLAWHYKKAIDNLNNKVEQIEILMDNGKKMHCYLHLPQEYKKSYKKLSKRLYKKLYKKSYPCVIIFSGIGSCKEELEMIARPLIERGVAVLACDMPGTGETLFKEDMKCETSLVEEAFARIMETLKKKKILTRID